MSMSHDMLIRSGSPQLAEYTKSLEETIKQQAERIKKLEAVKDALVTLVQLKEHKDMQGKNNYYLHYQPIAWEVARVALTALDKESDDG